MHTHAHTHTWTRMHTCTCTHTRARAARGAQGGVCWPCPAPAGTQCSPSQDPKRHWAGKAMSPARRRHGGRWPANNTDTYRYSQDGCLDRGPSVLPAVYNQDEPDASVLQAETRGRGQHAPRGPAMAVARLREELGVNGRPRPSHRCCSAQHRGQGRTEPPVALPRAHQAPPSRGSLRPRWTDWRCVTSRPDTNQLAGQRGGPGPSVSEPSCSTRSPAASPDVDSPVSL